MPDGPSHALVRKVSSAYAPAYILRGQFIDPELANAQHERYVQALRAAGLTVAVAPASVPYYDCVFIEDTAVVWQDRALIAQMTSHRQGEQMGIEPILGQTHVIHRLPADARLEGGDVLHAGDVTYVGLTERTNPAGVRSLQEFLAPFNRKVVAVESSKCLHLKSGVTYLGNNALLAVPGWFDMRHFEGMEVIFTADGEDGAANCLRIHDHLLILDGYLKTKTRIERFTEEHGVILTPLNVSEFQKGDGSLTCLSLIW